MTKKILIVGLCCIDVVNYVKRFPDQDSETRVFDMRTCLGGNSANTATVLSQLTSEARLCASLPSGNMLLEQLIKDSNIDVTPSIRRHAGQDSIPQSTVIVNEILATRTVLHYRGDLPEISAEEFRTKFSHGFGEYSWIHFEGRNFDEIEAMMAFAHEWRTQSSAAPELILSIEFEKIREFSWFEKLIKYANFIFMSKDFASSKGWCDGKTALLGLRDMHEAAHTTIICPWGEEGVYALSSRSDSITFVRAFEVTAIDTLGAGDCFIAATIWALNQGAELKKALEVAVFVAGQKCSQRGLSNIKSIAEAYNLINNA